MTLNKHVLKIKMPILGILLILAALVIGPGFFRSAQAFPTNTATLDNFNRVNASSLSGQASSGSYSWASGTIDASGSSTMAISSNQLSINNSNLPNAYINHQFGPDSEVNTSMPVLPANGSYVALWSRIQNPGSSSFSSYALVYIHATSGNATWSLRRFDTGSSVQLANISAPAITAGDSIGFDTVGSGSNVTLTAYRKSGSTWSSVGSVNDTSGNRITAAGYIGIELGDTTVRADDFGGGNVINNTAPAAPTPSLPADNATSTSTSPQLQLRTTDADNDDLKYKIEVCSDSTCSAILRTIDQTSSQTGWTGQDKQSTTAYTGSSTIGSSTVAVHDFQAPALANSTQYWWRAYAIDPNGSNAFGMASSIFSFTTESVATPGGGNPSGSGNNGSGSNPAQLDPDNTPASYTKWGK